MPSKTAKKKKEKSILDPVEKPEEEKVDVDQKEDEEVEEKVKPKVEETTEDDKAEEAKEEAKEEAEEEPKPVPSEPEGKSSGKVALNKWIFIFWVALTTGLFVFSAVGVYSMVIQGGAAVVPLVSEPTPTPESTSSPTPVPEETTGINELSVQVLNGSGVSGAAASVRDLLANDFDEIEVGNADSSNNIETTVQMKEDTPDDAFSAIDDSLADYEVVRGDNLDDESEYDIVVTVGQAS